MNPLARVTLGVLRPVARGGERAAVGALEAALAAPVTTRAVDVVLDSALVEHALRRLLNGALVEAVVEDLGRYDVVERAVRQMLADGELERILDSPELERLVGRVIESHLADAAVARLLESEELWLLVDVVARSPSVTQAISHQGVGFAGEMAGVVRDRSRNGDARVERLARRLLRREVTTSNATRGTTP
jgi:hypothetical protein